METRTRNDMVEYLQKHYTELGRIDNVLEHIVILCDKCTIRKDCAFVYHETAIAWIDPPLKEKQTHKMFSKQECRFFVNNPKFVYLEYTGRKK